MDEQTVRERLAYFLKERHISGAKLSDAIGFSKNYINAVLSGEITLSVPTLLRICSFFHVSPSAFFTIEEKNPIEIDEILQESKKLSQDELYAVLLILRKMNEGKIERE